MPIELITTQDFRGGGLCALAFNKLALQAGLTQIRRTQFPVATGLPTDLSLLGEVLLEERAPYSNGVVLHSEDDMLLTLSWWRGSAELAVAGRDPEIVGDLLDEIVVALRDRERHEGEVSVMFWAGGNSPVNPRRLIAAPAWNAIEGNYADDTRAALSPLMAARKPGPGGLILWHGEPGTGKSYALRAMAREWSSWCDTWFISDPEIFLGHQASYLLQALLRDSGDRHRLVVLEDAGELAAADARAEAGQALSRLLNLTDGLLGAGLRTLVLVTTNEPVRKLHPAVIRPGRCWAEVDFVALPVEHANAWLAGRAASVDRPATIAELYALAGGRPLTASSGVGFGA